MERTPPSFRHAERFVGELSSRQRDVLCLIANGKTNSEIAEELGITLSGAKWHVSELLTKLGLDVREEAAAFYRWHQRRTVLSRAMGWLFGFGLVRPAVAAGALALATVSVAIALTAIGGESVPPEVPGRPFYLEGRSTEGQGQVTRETTFKWWQDDASHRRTESAEPSPPGFSLSVTDGSDTWMWDSVSNLYRKLPHPEAGCSACYPMFGGIGPVGAPDFVTYVSDLEKRDSTARVAGNETVLGRRTIRVERATSPGSAQRVTEWIDPDRLMVMRSNLSDSGFSRTLEITRLDYDVGLAPDLFVWSPPAGGVEDRCSAPAVPPSIANEGFLSPDSSASGYRLSAWGFVAARDGTCGQAHLDYEADSGGRLQVGENREDPESVITGPRDDPREAIPGVTAFAWNEPGYALVAWVHDGLGVQLKSDTMTIDDLLAFARALLVPTPDPVSTPSP